MWRPNAIPHFNAIIIGPGSFYTSLMPILLVRGVAEKVRNIDGPVVLVANLLTVGRGMWHFTAAEEVRLIEQTIGRPVDVVVFNTARPSAEMLARYAAEHKLPLDVGDVPSTS